MSRLYQDKENVIHILHANLFSQAICGAKIMGMRKLHPDVRLSVVDCDKCNILYLKGVRNAKTKN